jgi:hypothetical protein
MNNDFTKEELQLFARAISIYDDVTNKYQHEKIVRRLLSMIENYDDRCETGNHEYMEHELECKKYGCDSNRFRQCIRCGDLE